MKDEILKLLESFGDLDQDVKDRYVEIVEILFGKPGDIVQYKDEIEEFDNFLLEKLLEAENKAIADKDMEELERLTKIRKTINDMSQLQVDEMNKALEQFPAETPAE